mgnify:CR=1 FL=1
MKLEKYRIEYENGIVQEKYLIPKECDYFTEKSPLGEGIKSGKLVLPETQGGTTKVKITKIKSDVKVINSETDNYWWCDRCERDNSGSEMCPCPRGSCEAYIMGTINKETTIDKKLTEEQIKWNKENK